MSANNNKLFAGDVPILQQAISQCLEKHEVRRTDHFCGMVYESHAMKQICSMVVDLAETDSTFVIQGETGAG